MSSSASSPQCHLGSLSDQVMGCTTDDKITDPNGRIWDVGSIFFLLKCGFLPTGWDPAWLHQRWARFDYGLISHQHPYVVMEINPAHFGDGPD